MISDYVTLFINPTTIAATPPVDNIYTFDLNNVYFSDQRSATASVSIVGGTIEHIFSSTSTCLTVDYVNGSQNSVSNILAHAYVVDNELAVYNIKQEQINLFVTARPDKIQLRFFDNEHIAIDDVVTASITLKYSYYNSEQVSRDLHNEFTNTL
jgi:hypothetical protein